MTWFRGTCAIRSLRVRKVTRPKPFAQHCMSHICSWPVVLIHLLPQPFDIGINEKFRISRSSNAPHNIRRFIAIPDLDFVQNTDAFGVVLQVCADIMKSLPTRIGCGCLISNHEQGPIERLCLTIQTKTADIGWTYSDIFECCLQFIHVSCNNDNIGPFCRKLLRHTLAHSLRSASNHNSLWKRNPPVSFANCRIVKEWYNLLDPELENGFFAVRSTLWKQAQRSRHRLGLIL